MSSFGAADKGWWRIHVFARNGMAPSRLECVDPLLPTVFCPLVFGRNRYGLGFTFGGEFLFFFFVMTIKCEGQHGSGLIFFFCNFITS